MFGSIKTKIVVLQIGLVLSVIISLGALSYLITFLAMRDSQRQNLEYLAMQVGHGIDTVIAGKERLIEKIGSSDVIEDYFKKQQENFMTGYFGKFMPEFDMLAYVDSSGMEDLKVINGKAVTTLFNISDSNTFKQSIDNPNKVFNSYSTFCSEVDGPCLEFCYHNRNFFDEFVGVIFGRVSIKAITRNIYGFKENKSGFAVLVDSAGNILACPDKDKILKKITIDGVGSERVLSEIKTMKSGFGRVAVLGIDGYIAYLPVPGQNWSVVAILPYNQFVIKLGTLLNTMLLVGFTILTVGIVLSMFLAKDITEPILKLIKKTSLIATGDFSQRADTNSKDEIGTLARSFNQMAENLQKTTTSIANLNHVIAERQKAVQSLRKSERRFEEVAKNSGDWIWEINAQGLYTYSSPAVEQILGYNVGEIVGRKYFYDMFTPDKRKPMKKIILNMMARKKNLDGLVNTEVHKDGNVVVVETSAVPMLDQKGTFLGYRGVNRNITERKRTEEALRQAREAAEQANRAKSDFLSNMSHEIRTPLNGIMGFSRIIAQSKDVSPRERKQAEQITAECRKLMELINQFLDLAKIEAGKMELNKHKFSLRDLMADIISAFNVRAVEKNIGFSVSIHPEVPDVLIGDNMRLHQVLINLIDNAIKFTRQGEVSVTISGSEEKDNNVKIMFSVIDTGIGIPKEKLELIFESFTQADSSTTREYGGTGLGTTICKQIVGLMGGQIGVESEIGKGSTFWFVVPFEKGTIEKIEKTEEENRQPTVSLNNAKVLIVEDYPTNQEVAKYLIETAGGIVSIAENGQIALEMFKEHDFDVILMDVQMPKMDGYQATQEIRKLPRGDKIPVIGMTANAFEKDRQACLAAGMNDFVSKPLEFEHFLAVVAHWLTPANVADESPAQKIYNADTSQTHKKEPDTNMPIDVEAYVKRMGGNREVADVIIKGFIKQIPIQLKNIEEAIKFEDIETVDREAHSIKGGALNVFANGLMQTAKDLEMHAKSGSLKNASELLEKIRKEYNRLIEFEEASKADIKSA